MIVHKPKRMTSAPAVWRVPGRCSTRRNWADAVPVANPWRVPVRAGRLPRPTDHRDPFDRLLIWTAINEDFTLVSGDDDFPDYVPHGLKICW